MDAAISGLIVISAAFLEQAVVLPVGGDLKDPFDVERLRLLHAFHVVQHSNHQWSAFRVQAISLVMCGNASEKKETESQQCNPRILSIMSCWFLPSFLFLVQRRRRKGEPTRMQERFLLVERLCKQSQRLICSCSWFSIFW